MTTVIATEEDLLSQFHSKVENLLSNPRVASMRKTRSDFLARASAETGKSLEVCAVVSLSPSRHRVLNQLKEHCESSDNGLDTWVTSADFYKLTYGRSVQDELSAGVDRENEQVVYEIEDGLGWLTELAGDGYLNFDLEKGWSLTEEGKKLIPHLDAYYD
jgi:hypothetical protein